MKQSTQNRLASIPGYAAAAIGAEMIWVSGGANTMEPKWPVLFVGAAGFLVIVIGVAVANLDEAVALVARLRARFRSRRGRRPRAA